MCRSTMPHRSASAPLHTLPILLLSAVLSGAPTFAALRMPRSPNPQQLNIPPPPELFASPRSFDTSYRGSKLFGGYRIMPRPCNSSSGEEGICMFNHECQNRRGEVLSTCMDGFLFGACCRLPPGVTLPPALPLPPSTTRPTRPPTPPRPTPMTPTPPPYLPSSGLLNPGLLTDTVLVYENGTILNDTEIIPLEIFYPPSRHPPSTKPPPYASWSKRPPGSPPVTDPPNLPGAIEHIISMLDGQPPKAPSPTSFPPTRDPPPSGPARPPQTRPPPPTVIVLGPLHPHPLPHPDILPPYASMRPATTTKPAMQGEDDLKIDDDNSENSPSGSQEGLVPPQPVPQPPTAGTPTIVVPTTTTTSEPSTTTYTTARVPSTPQTTTTPIEGTTPIFEDAALHDKVSALVSNIVSSLAVDFHVLQDAVLGQNTTAGVRPNKPPSSTVSTTTRRPARPPVEPVVAENDPEPTKPTGTRPQRPQGTRPTRPASRPTRPTSRPTRPSGGSATPKPTRPTRPTRPPQSDSRPTKPSRPPSTASTTKRPTRRPTKRPTTTTTPKPPPTEVALVAEVEPPSTTTTTTTTTTAAPPTTTSPDRPVGDFRSECGVRPLMKTSGKKSGRIVGGKGATFGEWPWQVLVRESTWLGLFTKNKCGGVLITSRYVMTAAHCQPGFLASLIAVFGEYDLTSELESRRAITRNVRRVIVHRRYDAATFENDLALLELDSPVTYQQHIVPICMPKDGDEFTGRIATVTGWGRLRYGGGVPNVLQEVQVPVMENNVCQEMFRTAGHAKTILTSFVCAGYANGQKDSCEGDSGGPLMTERDDGRWVLIGTVSHGIKCAAPYLPGVYMRTTYYKPWLHSITGVE